MKAIKKIFGVSFVTSIVFLIFGLFLVFRTEGTIHLISSLIGMILLLNGGWSLIKYFKEEKDTPYNIGLIYGVVAIIAGIILILNPKAVASVLPFILGIYFTITGVVKLKYALDIREFKKENPTFMLILSILTILCGILFIINPFGGAIALTQIIGIFMIIYACLDIANYLSLKKDLKHIDDLLK